MIRRHPIIITANRPAPATLAEAGPTNGPHPHLAGQARRLAGLPEDLDVDPDATLREIAAAIRAAVPESHPERVEIDDGIIIVHGVGRLPPLIIGPWPTPDAPGGMRVGVWVEYEAAWASTCSAWDAISMAVGQLLGEH